MALQTANVLIVLGSVLLAFTGAEALYAERGVTSSTGLDSRSLDYLDVPLYARLALPTPGLMPYAYAGPMLSFELDQAKVDPNRFVRGLRIIKPAVSLGGVESTICAPAVTSHAKISAAERKRIGISDSLLRLSVGIEQVDDLIEDIEQAMKA